ALAVGTPIVTWPGEFMRGRHTYGFYRLMGVEDCVVPDQAAYAETAVGIATTPGRRAELSQSIAGRSAALFEDVASIRALEEWLIRVAG
ncbi:MAG TPA: hypothetical protein VMQ11_14880, partial [Alphaproteobacteria bacterium]|nr:hypothetical protein [Alphaproteobacteria bacterium]